MLQYESNILARHINAPRFKCAEKHAVFCHANNIEEAHNNAITHCESNNLKIIYICTTQTDGGLNGPDN